MKVAVYGSNAIALDIIKYSTDPKFLEIMPYLSQYKFEHWETIDFSNKSFINSLFIDNQYDVFINTEFENDLGWVEENMELAHRMNVDNPLSLAFYAKLNNCKYIQIQNSLNDTMEWGTIDNLVGELKDKLNGKGSTINALNVYSSQDCDDSFIKQLYKQGHSISEDYIVVPNKYVKITYSKNLCEYIYKVIVDTNVHSLVSDNINWTIRDILSRHSFNPNRRLKSPIDTINFEDDLVMTTPLGDTGYSLLDFCEEMELKEKVAKINEIQPIVGNIYSYLALDNDYFED